MKTELIKIDGYRSIYKGVPPFMQYTGGFGYYGVLLEEEATGKLQCHLCGSTHLNLAKHIFHKHKDISPKEYKIETGLNLTTPLMAESTRKFIKNNFLDLTEEKKAEVITRLRNFNKRLHSNPKRQRKNKATLEMNNKYGTCPEQVKNRFLQKYSELGRIPNWKELDGGLRSVIETRFKSYEDAVVTWGISREEYQSHISQCKVNAVQARRDNNFFPKYDETKVREQYTQLLRIKGRFPTWGEIIQSGLPKRSVFMRAFNGMNKTEVEKMLLNKIY